MTDQNEELWKVLDEMAQEEEVFSKKLDDDADDFWENLDYDQKLLAFYAVTSRINQGELVDKGSYRHILYETFKFGPEAYVIGMNAGLMALHNAIGDGETYQEMKQANRLEVIDENGRSYVKYLENDERFRYSIQDEGRTLKLFIDKVKYVKLEDRYSGYDLSTTCSKCGMVWKGVMSYSCPQSDCPMQFKAT